MGSMAEESTSSSSSPRHGRDFQERQARSRRLEYAKEFMLPDWLNDVPEDMFPNVSVSFDIDFGACW